jgi:hypothetical protein
LLRARCLPEARPDHRMARVSGAARVRTAARETMKGYIYITGTGVDPSRRAPLADPTFETPPTLGPCMPNVRRRAAVGDWIFTVSGRIPEAAQYLIGGLQVAEKIHALEAYARLPQNRLRRDRQGRVPGNIIVRPDGSHDPLDWHAERRFKERAENFIIGGDALALTTAAEVEIGRHETLPLLASIKRRPDARRVIDAIGRMSHLDASETRAVIDWLRDVKRRAIGC